MKKQIILVATLLMTGVAIQAQVGMNNDAPKATLDITAKNPSGIQTATDGILIPRVDRQRAQNMTSVETSTLIYVNNIATGSATGKAANINAIGFYYFDGSVWQKFGNVNTYAGSTSVRLNGNSFEREALTGDVTASVNNNATTISNNAVTSAKILDGTVALADLANNSVNSAKIVDGSVVTADLADNSVTSAKIVNGTIVTEDLADNSVTSAKILDGTVALADLADNSVNSAKIVDGTITNADLAVGIGGIYKGSGSLSGNTIVTQAANTLAFNSTAVNGFSVDGTTFSVDAANDRIGIGTASPATKFDMPSGEAKFGAANSYQVRIGAGYVDFYNNSGTLKGNVALNNTTGNLFINALASSGNTILNSSSGNVGIGTSSPGAKLEVNNGSTAGAIKIVDGTQGAGKVLTSDANGVGTWQNASLRTVTASTTLTATDNGGFVYVNSSSATTVTVPSSLGAGFHCVVIQQGTGQVTIAGSGVTMTTARGTKTRARYSAVGIIKQTTSAGTITGDAVN